MHIGSYDLMACSYANRMPLHRLQNEVAQGIGPLMVDERPAQIEYSGRTDRQACSMRPVSRQSFVIRLQATIGHLGRTGAECGCESGGAG